LFGEEQVHCCAWDELYYGCCSSLCADWAKVAVVHFVLIGLRLLQFLCWLGC
jgi:hypothetical protein